MKHGGRTFHPLDDALRLRNGEASDAVRVLVTDLARRFSYRDVARIVSEVTGERFGYQQVSRLAGEQRRGH